MNVLDVLLAVGALVPILTSAAGIKRMLELVSRRMHPRQQPTSTRGIAFSLKEQIRVTLRIYLAGQSVSGRGGQRPQLTLPSPSRGLLRLAVRRLPTEMSAPQKERWGAEMDADLCAIRGRLSRLRFAFHLWRKGAPSMPVGAGEAARSASE